MTYVGIDDTDTLDSPGTNQLARAIAESLKPHWQCNFILRHQLLDDPRVPYTSKNGSASLSLQRLGNASVESLIGVCRAVMCEWFVEGSDPGLCVAENVTREIVEFGRRCKTTLVAQGEARELAAAHNVHLEGLGGTEGGVIGALAAVGLAVGSDDGRVVQLGQFPDDLAGLQPIHCIRARGVRVHDVDTGCDVTDGDVDLGKRLRPNRSASDVVLFVRRAGTDGPRPQFTALKLP